MYIRHCAPVMVMACSGEHSKTGQPGQQSHSSQRKSRHAKSATTAKESGSPAASAALGTAFAGMLNITGHASVSSDTQISSHVSLSTAPTINTPLSTSGNGRSSGGGTCAAHFSGTQQEFASSRSDSSLGGSQPRPTQWESPAQMLPQHRQQKQQQPSHSGNAGTKRPVKAIGRHTRSNAAEHSMPDQPLGNVVGTPLCSRQPNVNQGGNALHGDADQLPDRLGQKTMRPAVCKGLIKQRAPRQQGQPGNKLSSKHDCVGSGISVQAPVFTVSPTQLLVQQIKE